MEIKVYRETNKDGQKIAEITSVDMLGYGALPTEYTKTGPAVYRQQNGNITYVGIDEGRPTEEHTYNAVEADQVPLLLLHIQMSGARLHKIMDSIRATRASWDGTTTLEI
jgi:hypothetical protein